MRKGNKHVMFEKVCHEINFVAAGHRHPQPVLHGGHYRLLSQHHRCRHHHGSDAGHFCRHHHFLSADTFWFHHLFRCAVDPGCGRCHVCVLLHLLLLPHGQHYLWVPWSAGVLSVPDDRLSADDGKDEQPAESRGIHQRCSHDLPGHSHHLPLPAGEEVILCTTHSKPKWSNIIM